jgi:hypothetical protein
VAADLWSSCRDDLTPRWRSRTCLVESAPSPSVGRGEGGEVGGAGCERQPRLTKEEGPRPRRCVWSRIFGRRAVTTSPLGGAVRSAWWRAPPPQEWGGGEIGGAGCERQPRLTKEEGPRPRRCVWSRIFGRRAVTTSPPGGAVRSAWWRAPPPQEWGGGEIGGAGCERQPRLTRGERPHPRRSGIGTRGSARPAAAGAPATVVAAGRMGDEAIARPLAPNPLHRRRSGGIIAQAT